MEFSSCCTEKRYCIDGEELLRAVISIPEVEGEAYRVLSELFCGILDRSLFFAENTLFPSLRAEYASLSPHDRKFAIPRRVYRVVITTETTRDEGDEETIRMTLTSTLRKRGKTEFERTETRIWSRDGKQNIFLMIDTDRKSKSNRNA